MDQANRKPLFDVLLDRADRSESREERDDRRESSLNSFALSTLVRPCKDAAHCAVLDEREASSQEKISRSGARLR